MSKLQKVCTECGRPFDDHMSVTYESYNGLLKSETARQKVLIVDDMETNIKILALILKPFYEIIVATNGEDAISLAASELPDLVLLDIMMPGMDGYKVCQTLRSNETTTGISVIFITAMDDVEDEANGFKVGGHDFITKPINPTIVKARVDLHLKLKRQKDLLARISMIDSLTGIANRRRFDETLALEWRRCHRSGTELSVIMIDVDYFKSFNDHYGHLAGDECLNQIAGAIAKEMHRGADLVARFGGEEFACLLPDTGYDACIGVAERIRDSISGLQIEHSKSSASPHVSISLGVATLIPDEGEQSWQLVDLADRRLYEAKENGRNRVRGINQSGGVPPTGAGFVNALGLCEISPVLLSPVR